MQSIKVKCDLAPKLTTITLYKYCRRTVKVKTNSLYHRNKRTSNKIRILQTKLEFREKKLNTPNCQQVQSSTIMCIIRNTSLSLNVNFVIW